MFNYTHTNKPVFDQNNQITHYQYMNGEIVKILAKSMNFTPVYIGHGFQEFGFQFPNGTFTGALAFLENGLADVLGNTFYMLERNTSNSVYLRSVRMKQLLLIIRAPEMKKSVLLAMLQSIDFPTKMVILVCYIMFPTILFLMLKFMPYEG